MFQKEIIDIGVGQILTCVHNFVNVLTIEGESCIKIGTSNNTSSYLCSISISAKDYIFSKDLSINGKAKRILYDKVFWQVFDKYLTNSNVRLEKNIYQNDLEGNCWQLIMTNKEKKNRVILEFAIEDEQDFKWISNSFAKWDYLINKDKQKIMKLGNK